MDSPSETEISALDTLVHGLEFENKNYIKMIEKENQTILELQAQTQQITNEAKRLSLVIPQLEENIKHLDKQYISILDNIDSQKKTKNLMTDHELALTKQLEVMRITTEEKNKFYKDQISNYTKVRDEYMEQYATLSSAVKLNAKKSELSEITKELNEIYDKKREIKQQIQEKENYLNAHVLERIVVKIAETKLEITKLNEQITQTQAEKTVSIEYDQGIPPENLNHSQPHSKEDNEGSDINMEIDTNYSLTDINKHTIHEFNKLSLDVNTDCHGKIIPNKTVNTNLCSGNNEEIETAGDCVGDEELNMIETDSHATMSNPEVMKLTAFSTEIHQWNQSENTKCYPKPSVPYTLAASTTATRIFSSFTLPSLPKLPTFKQFTEEQIITPLSQQSQVSDLTQGKSETKSYFPKSQLHFKPVLQSEQLFRGFNESRMSTAIQFQKPSIHLALNAEPGSTFNEDHNITSSVFQKSTLPLLQKEQSTGNNNEVRSNTFHQFEKPTSFLQSDHSRSKEMRNITPSQFQKPIISSRAIEESAKSLEKVKSATSFQLHKPSLHYALPSSNLQPATLMTQDNFKASTPRFMPNAPPLPVAKFKSQAPSATRNNDREENESQSHVDIVKDKEFPQTQGLLSAFPRLQGHIAAPAPNVSTASDVSPISIFKINTQLNDTDPQATKEQSMQRKKSSQFSFFSLKTRDDETTDETKTKTQNTMLEESVTEDGAGFLSSFNFDEPISNEADQSGQAVFSLNFESCQTKSSKCDGASNSLNNETSLIFGRFLSEGSDNEDDEPAFLNVYSNSHEPMRWNNFMEDDSPQPDTLKKLLFTDK